MSFTIKPIIAGAPNPGFAAVPATEVKAINEVDGTTQKVKGKVVDTTRFDITGPDGSVFAALHQGKDTDVLNTLAWVRMKAHGGKRIGELIPKEGLAAAKFHVVPNMKFGSDMAMNGNVPRMITTVRGQQVSYDPYFDGCTIQQLLGLPG